MCQQRSKKCLKHYVLEQHQKHYFEKHTRGLGTALYIPESKFVQIYGKQIYANLHALKNQCSSEPLVQGHICSKLAVVGGRIFSRSSKSSVYIQL